MSSSPSSAPRSPVVVRCTACGSRIRPEETWCSLCHHPVATAAPAPEPVPEPVVGEPAGSAVPVPPDGPTPPIISAPADPAVLAEADRLLAELAAVEAGTTRAAGAGALLTRVGGGRGGGAVLAAVGGVLLLIVGVLGLTLLGLLL